MSLAKRANVGCYVAIGPPYPSLLLAQNAAVILQYAGHIRTAAANWMCRHAPSTLVRDLGGTALKRNLVFEAFVPFLYYGTRPKEPHTSRPLHGPDTTDLGEAISHINLGIDKIQAQCAELSPNIYILSMVSGLLVRYTRNERIGVKQRCKQYLSSHDAFDMI